MIKQKNAFFSPKASECPSIHEMNYTVKTVFLLNKSTLRSLVDVRPAN